MNSFEKLQSEWEKQPDIKVPEDGFEALLEKINVVKNKQKITNVVLGTTVLVLVAFLIYVSGYMNAQVFLGLSLMIGSLIIRIAIEVFSVKRLKSISAALNTNRFKEKLTDYYQNRIKVHYVFTPIIFITYIIGFLILLPIFKENLSNGFYTYIVISAIVFLVVFWGFIFREIQKELKDLKILKEIN